MPTASVSRIERLFNLLNVLIGAERPVSADHIREAVPGYPESTASFQRQFERDKIEVKEMGLPLRVETVPGVYPEVVGYRIPRVEAYLRDPGLDRDELAALHLAASAIRLAGIEGSGGLWKLGGRPVSSDRPATGLAVTDLPADERLGTLFRAVAERRRATFSYGGLERALDPYRLDCTRGRWYVSGHDHSRAASRNFRVGRIQGTVTTSEPGAFDRPSGPIPGVHMDPWAFGSGEPVTATVLIDPGHGPMAKEVAPEAAVVEERPDGSLVLALAVTDADAFRSFVLGFLEHAEVLAPPKLRNDMVRWLTAIAEDGR